MKSRKLLKERKEFRKIINKFVILLSIVILIIIGKNRLSLGGQARHRYDKIILRPKSINIDLKVEDKELFDLMGEKHFMGEEQEDHDGGTIYVNAGYHENGPIADYKHDGVVWGNEDLNLCDATILIEDINKRSISGKWKLIFDQKGSGNIRIWKGPQDEIINGEEYPITSSDFFQMELKIEGIKGSSFTNDISITAEFISDDPNIPCTTKDEVKMTVIETKFMLTFDDGPTLYCEIVVNKLKLFRNENGNQVKAAFFVVGCNSNNGIGCTECLSLSRFIFRRLPFDCGVLNRGNIRATPEIVRFIINNFHFIGNHTYCHTHYIWWRPDNLFFNFIQDDIDLWESVVSENNIVLQQPKLFRFPYLDDTPGSINTVLENKYNIIKGETTGDGCGWPIDIEKVKDILKEWRNKNNLNPNFKEPRVLVFHSSQPNTAINIDRVIEELQNAGFILTDFNINSLDPNNGQIIKPNN